ncbi:TPA: nitronate monooxygenase [Klebsiella quasipneumoniae]|nr:nitronate monooxygenase [Klebsiella quasipneumoniae]HBT5870738.1 nitronate monooxygenase [Klebsiella quasipneumoniae]HBT5982897.1 nitronate monooxygenase [Klebsiella quasipneumoniae]HBT6025072.1 nitronate monooxygenase [Klebsiella quasipneumoniae]HBT6130894.1 nitronate monooxygenase [Klebsiella quasipneumoniae]
MCCGSYFYSQYDNDVDLIIFKRDGKPPASLMNEEPMQNSLLSLLDIDYPLIQAPMAGVSTPALAAAVSHAGALGSLGLGASTVAQAEAMIVATRQLTDRPFNVNLFCHAPPRRDARREADWAETLRPHFTRFGSIPPASLREIYQTFIGHTAMLELLLDLSPAVVSFHFGLPEREAIQRLRQQGIVTLATATSLKEAQVIEEQGIDVVVAQGFEAGGHRGIFDPQEPDAQMSTFTLVQHLRRRLTIPVVAAGGIMDGAGVASVMQLGAQGAQLGTAFLLCPESAADAGYRAAIANSIDGRTVLTSAISGRPARCLANTFCAVGEACPASAVPDYPLAYDIGKALAAAAKTQGVHEYGAHWAGQGVGLIRECDAASLVRQLAAECGWN